VPGDHGKDALLTRAGRASADRLFVVASAMRAGATDAEVAAATAIDPWFVAQLRRIVDAERAITAAGLDGQDAATLLRWKRLGFSDVRLAQLTGTREDQVREKRLAGGVRATFARVDTCAAEMPGTTPYLYATWETESENEGRADDAPRVIVLGAGPNRIGQGLEFDYCCVHALSAIRELGYQAVMINSNPETVSTDYDVADRLYFEPITLETVLAVCEAERPLGVLVQLGGQTPLRLATELEARGVRLLGTSADAIDRAEDRGRFDEVLAELSFARPESAVARSREEVLAAAERLGWPVLVRPSYVLGGRSMKIARNPGELGAHLARMNPAPGAAILVDRFLDDAVEIDVDCVSDGTRVVIGGVMEHLERAGVHSGDSATVLPPFTFAGDVLEKIEHVVRKLALSLGVVGLMNAQLAVKDGEVYVLEVNPRASRTVPFVSKATGVPLARIATKVMLGKTLDELGVEERHVPRHVAAKECVFPFKKLPGVDTILGPEMRSTGEVMGVDTTPGRAYAKALRAIGAKVERPRPGGPREVLLSVSPRDRGAVIELARRLRSLGFDLGATPDTQRALAAARVPARVIEEGEAALKGGEIALAVITAEGDEEIKQTSHLRRAALASGVTCFTTAVLARAGCAALEEDDGGADDVRSLQEWYRADA
jgi:carbamoyl-phosphate synthase large subunit